MIKKISPIIFFLIILSGNLFAQTTINVNVNASSSISVMKPIWRDHYENHLMAGYGGNPNITGPHISFLNDPSFATEMAELQPRYIRISIGRIDNPPDTNYSSTNTNVLRNLPYEFYKGGNNMVDANNLSNYDFTYIDSMITAVQSMGAEPFITMDYMPFTLSSDTVPNYQAALSIIYNLAYDNKIRNSPPSTNAIYGRVMYQLIKHCYTNFGVTYFEHWNEPDQQWANPIMAKFFWTGDEYDLYDSYAAIADEVSADVSLASNIKLGGCSFAFYSFFNLIPIRFLQEVQANNKKFDFLSFHPYSDTQYKGGYDSAKVALATSWRNTYVPSAELINAEWGRIDPTTTTYGDLDYGLNKTEHIIDMLDRNISMSFEVCLFDADSSTNNFTSLGMYRVGPIFPKPSAYVFYNLNKMNDALNRLPLTINPGMYALAGKSNTNDKVVIILPAENPASGSNSVNLTVSNLPWGSGNCYAKRYELTESSYLSGTIFNQTESSISAGSVFTDTVVYSSIGNSGRLIVWELSSNPLSSLENFTSRQNDFTLFPNPNTGSFEINFSSNSAKTNKINIYNSIGQIVYEKIDISVSGNIKIDSNLNNGIYFLGIETENGVRYSKFIINK